MRAGGELAFIKFSALRREQMSQRAGRDKYMAHTALVLWFSCDLSLARS